MKYLLFFALGLILFSACKKEVDSGLCAVQINVNHSYDKIFPSDYLEAYPGSWWEYDNGNIDSCKKWVAVFAQFENESGNCTVINQDRWFLPQLPGWMGNVAGSQRIYTPIQEEASVFQPIIDTNVGIFYDQEISGGEPPFAFKTHYVSETVARLNSMTIGNNTYSDVLQIELMRQNYYYDNQQGANARYQRFWLAKNVGIIKYEVAIDNFIEEEGELVNHYIAPH